MKNLIYFLFLLFLCNYLHAQESVITPLSSRFKWDTEVIDSGMVRVYYAVNAVDINDIKTYDDLQRLDIGTAISKCYSYFIFCNDSLKRGFVKKYPNARSIPSWPGEKGKNGSWWYIVFWSDFYKDFKKSILTEHALMPLGVPHYQYTEEIPIQDWKLLDDTLTVCGYLCQKATCRFRGNDFVAWFAPELPIPNGPWKFGGLPGLILKVNDTALHYVFECIKIESHTTKFPIFMSDNKFYQKIDRVKLRQLDKAIYNNYYKVADTQATYADGTPVKFTPIPYHPLELE